MRLLRIEACASGTFALYFERPSSFDFVPGQFVELSLEAEAPADPYRSFSIASAPCEPELMIATRSRDSAFKRALLGLAPPADVQIEGPYGKLALRTDSSGPHVLIAGGIGITPFRSMLVQAGAEISPEKMLLFYANRDEAGAAFLQEMTGLAQRVDTFTFVPTLTRASDGWAGETGYIDGPMLCRYLDSLDASYYVSGPPAMVEGTRQMLADLGIAGERIVTESFEGY